MPAALKGIKAMPPAAKGDDPLWKPQIRIY